MSRFTLRHGVGAGAWQHEEDRIVQFWEEVTKGSPISEAELVQRVVPNAVDAFLLKCRRRYLASAPSKRALFVEVLDHLFEKIGLGRIGSRLKAEIEVLP